MPAFYRMTFATGEDGGFANRAQNLWLSSNAEAKQNKPHCLGKCVGGTKTGTDTGTTFGTKAGTNTGTKLGPGVLPVEMCRLNMERPVTHGGQ